jgi:hypothetical protein
VAAQSEKQVHMIHDHEIQRRLKKQKGDAHRSFRYTVLARKRASTDAVVPSDVPFYREKEPEQVPLLSGLSKDSIREDSVDDLSEEPLRL